MTKKLTPVQQEVMKWIDGGWMLYHDKQGRIVVNGNKVCDVRTVLTLQNMGLIVRFDERYWKKAGI